MTLVELMIAIIVLAAILFATYELFAGSADSYATGVLTGELERNSTRVMERIVEAIEMSGTDTAFPVLGPPLSSSGVVVQQSLGFSSGAVQWGPMTIITFDYDPADPDDGVDNNGNGLIDEGMIVLRENAGEATERRVILARHVREYLDGEIANGADDNGNGLVDERGLALSVESGVWTIRLSLERTNSRGRTVTHTTETSASPRN
jgi:hypothetical protein